MENAEINNIIKIVGLQYKKSYDDPESLRSLRYGKIMIMTDQVSCGVGGRWDGPGPTSASLTPLVVPGSRRLPHQRTSHQLLPPQLAVAPETHLPGGVHHAHRQGNGDALAYRRLPASHPTAFRVGLDQRVYLLLLCCNRRPRISRKWRFTAFRSLKSGRSTRRIIKVGI